MVNVLDKYNPYNIKANPKPKINQREFARLIPAELEGKASPQELSKMYQRYIQSQYSDPYDWLYDDVYSKKQNPEGAINLILFGTFGLFAWYMYQTGFLDVLRPTSWGYEKITDGTETPKKTTGTPISNTSAMSDNIFPSLKPGEGVYYTDVYKAFDDLWNLYFSITKSQVWSLTSQVDPRLTRDSILPYKAANWIPASAFPPEQYERQYNATAILINGLL